MPNQAMPATTSIGPSARASSPDAMKMLIPLPTCAPETLATMAGAGAWKAAMLIPATNSISASAA